MNQPPEITRADYNAFFEQELKKLNPAQREAVEQIEGPVLVLAGPGTGKTHILTARIGRILAETDAQPHNILCLTFTDAGVFAMRQRLLEFIGPDAHKVHIFTFHSFCNTIIQENLELFGRHDLEPMSDLERVEIIRKMLENLEPGHPMLEKKDAHFYENHLYNLFKTIKSENWTPKFVSKQIDKFLKSLPERKEYIYQRNFREAKKGDVKKSKVSEITWRMERLREASKLLPLYAKWMEKFRRYDFDDMILWVLKAFQENPDLLRNYQEQYLYFLVDEYQDTNGAQNQILHKLIEYWNNPNIFVVGDDDQSIYEFQGARLKNIMDFYYNYENDIKLVVLKDNYRSSQNVLDASRHLIENNQARLINSLKKEDFNINKNLRANHQAFANISLQPLIVQYGNRAEEDADIVYQIEQLWKQGFPLNEVAVIYARHRQAQNILTLLEKKGIPYNTKRRINILDETIIQNLRELIEYLYKEYRNPNTGEEQLYRLMHFDFFRLNPRDMSALTIYMSKYRMTKNLKWRSILGDKNILKKTGVKDAEALLAFESFINDLIGNFSNHTMPRLLERIVNRSGLLKHTLHHPDKTWRMQVLKTFFDFVSRETDKNPRMTAKGLLGILRRMDDNKLPIGINKTIAAKEGVHLITAHSSKGLEFQKVFVVDGIKDSWEPTTKGNARRFRIPDTLTYSGSEDALEARRRLFYVALTRAKEYLHISFSRQDLAGKDLQRAVFVDELLTADKIELTEKNVGKDQVLDAQFLMMTEIEKPAPLKPDKATLDHLLEGFTLSISTLNRYLNCPLSFYYETILNIPSTSSVAASYGTAIHYALKRLHEKMAESEEKNYPPIEDILADFEREMVRQKSHFTKAEFDQRMQRGQRHLKEYYDQKLSLWHSDALVEYQIKEVAVKGVPLKGTIDKIDILDKNTVHLVDYKTGSLDKSKLRRPGKTYPIGGLYWRQLIFYKLLYENYRDNSRKALTASIEYLEPDKEGIFLTKTLTLEDSDVKIMNELILDSYNKIKTHDFFEGCNRKSCKWCNFVKRNIMPDRMNDEEAEELDD